MAPLGVPSWKLSDYQDQVDTFSKHWNSAPPRKFSVWNHPLENFTTYVSNVFHKPRKLARSASSTSLTYIRDADVSETTPLKRSPSFSSLAPSHALSAEDRNVTRYVPTYRMYRPDTNSWYHKAYAPRKAFETLHYRENAPIYPTYPSGRWPKPQTQSYLAGLDIYLRKYNSHRLKASDTYGRLAYRTYDQTINHRWTRFAYAGSSNYVSIPVGLPKYPLLSWHPYRQFRLREALVFY